MRDAMVSFFCRAAKAHPIFFSQLDSGFKIISSCLVFFFFFLLSFWILHQEAVTLSIKAIGIGGFCLLKAWVISRFLQFWLSRILVLRIVFRDGWGGSARNKFSQFRRQDNSSSCVVVQKTSLLAQIAIKQSTLIILIFLES